MTLTHVSMYLLSALFLQVPTGAIVYTLGAKVRARDSIFEDITNNTGMLAVQAGSHTEFEAQDCSFIGWTGTNVVRGVVSSRSVRSSEYVFLVLLVFVLVCYFLSLCCNF